MPKTGLLSSLRAITNHFSSRWLLMVCLNRSSLSKGPEFHPRCAHGTSSVLRWALQPEASMKSQSQLPSSIVVSVGTILKVRWAFPESIRCSPAAGVLRRMLLWTLEGLKGLWNFHSILAFEEEYMALVDKCRQPLKMRQYLTETVGLSPIHSFQTLSRWGVSRETDC